MICPLGATRDSSQNSRKGASYLALQLVPKVGGKRQQHLGRIVPQQPHGLHQPHVVRQLVFTGLDGDGFASISHVWRKMRIVLAEIYEWSINKYS